MGVGKWYDSRGFFLLSNCAACCDSREEAYRCTWVQGTFFSPFFFIGGVVSRMCMCMCTLYVCLSYLLPRRAPLKLQSNADFINFSVPYSYILPSLSSHSLSFPVPLFLSLWFVALREHIPLVHESRCGPKCVVRSLTLFVKSSGRQRAVFGSVEV